MTESRFPDRPILMVDDDEDFLQSLSVALKRNGLNHLIPCLDSRKAMGLLAERDADLVLLDLIMPHIDGRRLLADMRTRHPDLPVILLTGIDDVTAAVECIRQGAYDYLVKPVETDVLIAAVRRALEMRDLRRVNLGLSRRLLSDEPVRHEAFSTIVTGSPRMETLFRACEAVADSSEPVLVTGETGVGKELVARALHAAGRPDRPLVTVNAAGLDDAVFSDTLFGHVKGAFTGADAPRRGMAAEAAGGTLFLDEIGDLPPPSQVKLLRLIQEREYLPLGADKPRRATARIIAATNRDPAALAEAGRFRPDLYYRFNTHRVHVPPLRERPEDIAPLLDHFIETATRKLNRPAPGYPPDLPSRLSAHPFPGNVRELRAMVFDAVARSGDGRLDLAAFGDALSGVPEGPDPENGTRPEPPTCFSRLGRFPTLEEASRLLIQEAMDRTDGNVSAAAGMLGISRQALHQRLKRIG